mgnify:CR=1 FL=1
MDKKGGIKAVSDIQQKEIFLKNYWKAVLEQDEKTLPELGKTPLSDGITRMKNLPYMNLSGQTANIPANGTAAYSAWSVPEIR